MIVKKDRSRVLIIIPAYNEEKNIETVVKNLETNFPEYDYVVINDCSTDSTLQILEKNHFNYVSLPHNLGIGGAVQTGYMYARDYGYDIAIQLDGDGQHDPAYIKDIILPIENGDAEYVIGSRFIEHEGFQSSSTRRMGINILSGWIKMLCGKKVFDVTSGFRAVNRSCILHFASDYPQDYPEPKAIIDAVLHGVRITEVPVVMRERLGGESSITLWRSVYYMIKVSLDILLSRISEGGNRNGR